MLEMYCRGKKRGVESLCHMWLLNNYYVVIKLRDWMRLFKVILQHRSSNCTICIFQLISQGDSDT